MARKVTPVLQYARQLLVLHALDLQGKNDSAEADAVRDEMDVPWYAMTTKEQERMGGLSEDLYVLAEGGPPRIAMSEQQIQAWKRELEESQNRYLQGDIDTRLAFLRKPRPNNTPPPDGIRRSVIHFTQAQCWEKLGDFETAAVFMKSAEQDTPELSGLVLWLLQRASDLPEAKKYANKILNAPQALPLNILLASEFLFKEIGKSKSETVSLCHRLMPILKGALESERKISLSEPPSFMVEERLIVWLSMCYAASGKTGLAIGIFDRPLTTHPNNAVLYTQRGTIFLHFGKAEDALLDFKKAVQLGSKSCLPYLVLAQSEFDAGRYWDAKSLAQQASEKNGTKELLSLAYQVIAMSLSMINQKLDWVLENLNLAEKYHPGDPTIVQNRAIALARAEKKDPLEPWKIDMPDPLDLAVPQSEQLDDHFHRQMEQMPSVA